MRTNSAIQSKDILGRYWADIFFRGFGQMMKMILTSSRRTRGNTSTPLVLGTSSTTRGNSTPAILFPLFITAGKFP